jgi:hypothetical protein
MIIYRYIDIWGATAVRNWPVLACSSSGCLFGDYFATQSYWTLDSNSSWLIYGFSISPEDKLTIGILYWEFQFVNNLAKNGSK